MASSGLLPESEAETVQLSRLSASSGISGVPPEGGSVPDGGSVEISESTPVA